MARHMVYMAEPKVHLCDLSLAQWWAVLAGSKVYMAEPKVHVFDLIIS
jgi:hypothetical protein